MGFEGFGVLLMALLIDIIISIADIYNSIDVESGVHFQAEHYYYYWVGYVIGVLGFWGFGVLGFWV
jgi:hypothetical protein